MVCYLPQTSFLSSQQDTLPVLAPEPIVLSANLTPLPQRLYQPHRPLQPPEHLHHSRGCSTWLPDFPVPNQRLLASAYPQPSAVGLEHQEVCMIRWLLTTLGRFVRRSYILTDHNRIVDNTHLLDATEIFRKLNVHKKVRVTPCGHIHKYKDANPLRRNLSLSLVSTSSCSSSTFTA